MKYIDEYRDKRLIKAMAREIESLADKDRSYSFMEVCGTHTMAIARFGLKTLLPSNVKLLSGPGCPVCVTPIDFIDKAVAYAGIKDVIVTTFGDMLKVPGSKSYLELARSEGGDVRAVFSTLDALDIAAKDPKKRVVFLGVGFETTAPTIAAAINQAKKMKINNFSVLAGNKVMPPALKALVCDKDIKLDGFILPAHVSAIIGPGPYGFIARDHKIPCAIAGFEPLDIMQGIYMLLRQIRKKAPKVEIQYKRVVKPSGNRLAQKLLKDVFIPSDSRWRGLGIIPGSGLGIRKEFSAFDSENKIKIKLPKEAPDNKRCLCGEILKGKNLPPDCALYGKACTPERPIGPCMVSSEGTCSAYYLYKGKL